MDVEVIVMNKRYSISKHVKVTGVTNMKKQETELNKKLSKFSINLNGDDKNE